MSEYRIVQSEEFVKWMMNEPAKSQVQINKRLASIKCEGYFGDHKSVSFYEKGELKDCIWELRWNDGRRIYYAYLPHKKLLLILGGNKNGQSKDVVKAKNIYHKIRKNYSEEKD